MGGTASWTATPRSPDAMRAWIDARRTANAPVLVAVEPGPSEARVIGFSAWGPFRSGEGYSGTVEHSVYVAADARGRGVGTRLLEALISAARRAGIRRMIGGISADQPASLALHRRAGFVEQGRLLGVGRKNGRSLDLVLMVLTLTD